MDISPWGVPTSTPADPVPSEGLPDRCPECGDKTLIYIAHRKNKNIFLGCDRFPECQWNFVIPIEQRRLYARSLQHYCVFSASEIRKWIRKFHPSNKKTIRLLEGLAERLDALMAKRTPTMPSK